MKRLTDPELAAEAQRAIADTFRAKGRAGELGVAIDRYLTLVRFATLPHHDEAPE